MINRLIEDLEFISNIPKNAKPCFASKSLIYTDEWFATIRRRLNGEKGEKGVLYVKTLLNSCDKHYRMCKLDGRKLLSALKVSLKGIQNLIYTYRQDSQLSVSEDYRECYIKVEKLIQQIEKKPYFFSYNPNIVTLKTKQKFKTDLQP